MIRRRISLLLATLSLAWPCQAAEIVTITADNLAAGNAGSLPPAGKESDWIIGDHVLRNDRIVAVVAHPVPTRHANMTVRNVGGCIIDLTERARQNDQLGAFYPGGNAFQYGFAGVSTDAVDGRASQESADIRAPNVRGKRVELRVVADQTQTTPRAEVTYSLADGDDFVTVTSRYTNTAASPLAFEPKDMVRADRTFTSGADAATNLVWWDDEWFGQSYGLVATEPAFRLDAAAAKAAKPVRQSRDPVRYAANETPSDSLAAGASITHTRRLFPAGSLLATRAIALRMADAAVAQTRVTVDDGAAPVPAAFVRVTSGTAIFGGGRTDAMGSLVVALPRLPGDWQLVVSDPARGETRLSLDPAATLPVVTQVTLPRAGLVDARITDDRGGTIPCKVQFQARRPDAAGSGNAAVVNPDFGPDSADTALKNVRYSHDGLFRQTIAPGDYDVTISHGPEYDAVITRIAVERGKATSLAATLHRAVDTKGWVSADFHSHSTPSGDNTSSQLGRVQNLLCEHIEFAPCTEHSRITTYTPHLKSLGVEHLMATCSGMELTGSLLPVNHQNAFPLVEKPHTQDGGGPTVDNESPVAQIERLAMWDEGSDKLVQMNHPNLVQVLGDADVDGTPDAGFERMLGFVDVIEVHPPHEIFLAPPPRDDPRKPTSPIFSWLQMLNLGYRVPGVVNTDAHYNFHGSGWLRNYVASPTDDPAAIDTADIVKASERGRIVMTNGPFLGVRLTASSAATTGPADMTEAAGPGDDIADADGEITLDVRVQCPNWLDVDRVQVFVNGRPIPEANFTRRDNAGLFSKGVVKFAHEFPLRLDRDAHVIVATIGEGSTLGVVMGPEQAAAKPVAVTNPIFVDVGDDGFTPNGDLLGLPIPHQEKPTHRRHAHPHAHGHDHD